MFLDWYVKNPAMQDEDYVLPVLSVKNPAVKFNVRLNLDTGDWKCECDAKNSLWNEHDRFERTDRCVHIRRAYFYFRGMVGNSNQMRQKLQQMIEETNPKLAFDSESPREIEIERDE
jgi:hypothetical protein